MTRATSSQAGPRGVGLVEVLVALGVLALGLTGLIRLQLSLWQGVEAARQLDEASRLAVQDLESLRRWTHLDTQGSDAGYAGILAIAPTDLPPAPGSATRYRLERHLTDAPGPAGAGPLHKRVQTRVSWTTREGEAQSLSLPALIAAIDPRGAALATLSPPRARRTDGSLLSPPRPAGLPPDAQRRSDGRYAWKVDGLGDSVWLFDPATAQVREVCSGTAGLELADLAAAPLASCRAVSGLALWGSVRFATETANPGAAEALDPPSAALDLDLALSGPALPNSAWHCEDSGERAALSALRPGAVRYLCLIQPAGTPPAWSGRLDILPRGWTLGVAGGLRVCRYSIDSNGNGRIDNPEHPADYGAVDTALGQQNFLVVPFEARCPVAAPLPGLGPQIDAQTVAHQP